MDIPLAYLDSGFANKTRCNIHQLYHCVIIRGKAEVVEDEALKTASLNALVEKHEPGNKLDPITPDLPEYKACKVVRIEVESLSAKSDLVQKMPEDMRAKLAEHFRKRNLPGDRETVEAMGFEV